MKDLKPGDFITLCGVLYKVVNVSEGTYVKRKGAVEGIGFISVVACEG